MFPAGQPMRPHPSVNPLEQLLESGDPMVLAAIQRLLAQSQGLPGLPGPNVPPGMGSPASIADGDVPEELLEMLQGGGGGGMPPGGPMPMPGGMAGGPPSPAGPMPGGAAPPMRPSGAAAPSMEAAATARVRGRMGPSRRPAPAPAKKGGPPQPTAKRGPPPPRR